MNPETMTRTAAPTAAPATTGGPARDSGAGGAPGVGAAPGAGAGRDASTLKVAWLGPRPQWLDHVPAGALGGVELSSFDSPGGLPHVVHATAETAGGLRALKRQLPGAHLVLDLAGEPAADLGRRLAAQAGAADLVLAGSLFDLRELRRRAPGLAARSALFREPLDVDRWHSDGNEAVREDRPAMRRFRRHHRLVAKSVLFAGPYTPDGGLDVLLAAMTAVRRTHADARLLAVPLGEVAHGYLERCERAALALGHHGVIEWATPSDDELPLWFAAADIVCVPARDAVPPRAAWYAAAAGKPVVASDVPQLLEHVGDGSTGLIVPAGDAQALAAALGRLLGDPDEAARLGAAARRRVEAERSPAAAAHELRLLWSSATSERRPAPQAAQATTGTPWAARVDESPSPSTSR